MPLTTHVSPDGRIITISISERFDFNLHQAFRQVYAQAEHPNPKYIIDLRQTDYLDSSALGMLLLLREHMGNDGSNIDIVHCNPDIVQILRVANFHQLFNIPVEW